MNFEKGLDIPCVLLLLNLNRHLTRRDIFPALLLQLLTEKADLKDLRYEKS